MMGDLITHVTPPVLCMESYVYGNSRVYVMNADAYQVTLMIKEQFNDYDSDKIISVDETVQHIINL